MATKIKRSLYIGLGGTGMTALLHTKRMFIDTYGEVPPMIGFLGIDTDSGWYKRELVSKYGAVTLEPHEQLPILVNNAAPIYEVNQDRFNWMPERNRNALTSMQLGAGQVRTNGRFALTVNYDNLKIKLQSVLNQITSAHQIDNNKYELLGIAEVEIHLVFSVAGGTGSGTFLNMAYIIKEVAPQCKLMGYAVLPDVFRAMSSTTMSKVKANGYGAILDLDWMMHSRIGNPAFDLIYLRNEYSVKERPFNSVVFIDNKNANGDTYDHVDKLTEMISLALVTSAGQLSQASASVNDNLEKRIRDGEMNVENKIAWAGGMGASEIVFRGNDLSDIYALKAANFIIENMLNTCTDTDNIVNGWIDSPEVNIRENNGFDNLIDQILNKNPRTPLGTINEAQNAQAEVDGYVATAMPRDEELTRRNVEIQTRVKGEFDNLILREINKECGVGSVEKILLGILAQVNIMIGEMRDEREQLIKREAQQDQGVKAAVNDLKTYDAKILKRSSTKEAKTQDVLDATHQLVITKREIKRRDIAIQFYTWIINLINEESDHVRAIRKKLEDVYRNNVNAVASLQNRLNSEHQMFQIDLAQSYATSVKIDTNEVNFTNLLNTMPEGARFAMIDKATDKAVSDILFNYCKSLNGSRRWADMNINKVFTEMSDAEFENVVDRALRKSLPLFTYNFHGYTPLQNPIDIYYIGVPSGGCRFNKQFLKDRIQGTCEVDESVIGMNDRVIIYRQLGVVPAYAIGSIGTCKLEYDQLEMRSSSHIDAGLKARMGREDFSLEPRRSLDNTLELWVKGLIFGLIKNEDGQYSYRDKENDEYALDNYWVPLGSFRDDAFLAFKRVHRSMETQFEDEIDNLQKDKGAEYISSILNDVKDNYLEKYSQVNLTREQIKSHGNEQIARLITDELNYVTKQL